MYHHEADKPTYAVEKNVRNVNVYVYNEWQYECSNHSRQPQNVRNSISGWRSGNIFCCYIYRQMYCHTTVISPVTVGSTSADIVWMPMRQWIIIHQDISVMMYISASFRVFHSCKDYEPDIPCVYWLFCCIYEICSFMFMLSVLWFG